MDRENTTIQIVRKVLDVNDRMAAQNRRCFADKGIFVLNLMSSPGSGKTSILQKTLARVLPKVRTAVIVGDICTTNDADRLARSGAAVVQITTESFGGDCHLAAHVIWEATSGLDLDAIDLLIVENIGNLVCPAEFDVGEDLKGVVLSVTEGEDKPLKYPLMFRVCDFAILNKTDLLPHLEFDKPEALANIANVHPNMPIFEMSARSGDGLDDWIEWLLAKVREKREGGNAGFTHDGPATMSNLTSTSSDTRPGS